MDSLSALSIFLQVADTGSFAGTARQRGLSPSAVGKSVARLEDRLGVRLFHRSTRAVSLTSEGLLLRERSRRILCEIEAAEQELSARRTAPSGRLRVSMPLVGMLMMPPIMAFQRAFPQIKLDLDFSDRLVDIVDEGFDAVIRTGEARDSRLKMRRIGAFSHVVVASPAYLAERGVPTIPQDLTAHACLHHRYQSTGSLEPWPLLWGDDPVELPVDATANTLEPLICMAEAGFGLASLPRYTVQKQLKDGRLNSVLDGHITVKDAFHILWPSSRHPAPKVAAFVDFMSNNLQRELDEI